MTKLRVMLADDHAILRTGVRALVETTGRIEIVGEAADGREAVRLAEALSPDVLVIDIAMPNMNGIEAIRQLKRTRPKIGVIVLSVHGEPEYIVEALRAGALGYLLKVSAFEDLLKAIDAVAAGRRHLGSGVSDLALAELVSRGTDVGTSPLDKLSPREREVLQLIAEGYTTDEIAGQLHISTHTVQTHRKHLLEKLELHRTVDLARFALRHGLTSL